jgi:hypothetical protein
MPVGDRQKLITEIVGFVLGQKAQIDKSFDWFINKHTNGHFGKWYSTIDNIFRVLNGDITANQGKRTQCLECDAYFGGQYNLIFEFDEHQHFSSARLKTLELYPTELKVNFSVDEWENKCRLYKEKADKYRKSKTTSDFNFQGGRTAQRAYLDSFRDLLPQQHGLKPTLRINEFEVEGLYANNKESCTKIERLLKSKLHN